MNVDRTTSHDRVAALLLIERRVDEVHRAEVRGEDQDRVAEVDGAALAVGQAAVVEHLQQDVEHLRVRLLDLVEQHHDVRPAAHGLGELATLLVADVAGRRADQASDAVLLAVLAHVDAHHRVLVVEQEVGERLGQLGLADAGRAEEQERSGRPVRVGDAGARAAYRVAHRANGVALADETLAELVLHPQQLRGLPLEQPAGRDAGPGEHDVGDVVRPDLLLDHGVGALGVLGRGREVLLQLGNPAVQQPTPWPSRRRAEPAPPGRAGRRSPS